MRVIAPPVVLAALLCALEAPAGADPMPMSAGTHPSPGVDTRVGVLRETLSLDVELTRVKVDARLELENRGPAVELLVGFPCLPTRGGEGLSALECATPVDVRVRGRRVKLARTRTTPEAHLTWTMRLAAGEKVEVRVRYATPLRNSRYGLGLAGTATLSYRLVTGAAWDGPIGTLDMTVRLPVETVVHVTPGGYARSPGLLRWHLVDVEPSTDLTVSFDPIATSRYLGVYRAKSQRALTRAKAAGKADKGKLRAIAQDLREHPERSIEILTTIRKLSPAHGLPEIDAAAAAQTAIESAGAIELEAGPAAP